MTIRRGWRRDGSVDQRYVKAISESLVYSLLDKGQLGMVSRALLHLQSNILGYVLCDKTAKVALRQATHYYYLARKPGILQQANL